MANIFRRIVITKLASVACVVGRTIATLSFIKPHGWKRAWIAATRQSRSRQNGGWRSPRAVKGNSARQFCRRQLRDRNRQAIYFLSAYSTNPNPVATTVITISNVRRENRRDGLNHGTAASAAAQIVRNQYGAPKYQDAFVEVKRSAARNGMCRPVTLGYAVLFTVEYGYSPTSSGSFGEAPIYAGPLAFVIPTSASTEINVYPCHRVQSERL